MNSLLSRITIDPAICNGKPVIGHLRHPVESILESVAGGDSFKELLTHFPELEREDLDACLEFAAQSVDQPPIWLEKRVREALAEPADSVTVDQFRENMKAIADGR